MKFSVEWLQELSGSKLRAAETADLLSEHTAEAEVAHGSSFRGIIAAEVTKAEKHPNADRLRVIELTDGKKDYRPVVCGAWNFDVGARVALALPGASIPHDQHDPEGKSFTLGKAKIRGIESQGMICSGKELGLTQDGDGIMLLDGSHKLGRDLVVGDETLDVSSFANRPDLYSYLGVSREISALTKSPFNEPKSASLPKPGKAVAIEIRNNRQCSHFSAVTLTGVRPGPSPEFIQRRLKASGLRARNILVDTTNYVMLLTGQPLHAYDAAQVKGGFVVRSAEDREKILCLDGVERTLTKDMLVIADQEKPLGIAGLIGGQASAVSDSTTDIILEAANFDAVSIRKTGRKLNVRTDASTRFEKSLPISFVQSGLEMAVAILEQHAGAKIKDYSQAGKQPVKPVTLTFTAAQVNGLLGMSVPAKDQKIILERFGFKVTGAAAMKATVPSWRPDVHIWEDLAEEVVRASGVNSVPGIPPRTIFSSQMTDPLVDFAARVSDTLVGMGASEIYSYSFSAEGNQAALEIANPLNEDQRFMRTSILPNMAKTAELNSRYFDSGLYFEIGDIYRKGNGGYMEMTKLGLMAYSKADFPSLALNGIITNLGKLLSAEITFSQHAESSADVMVNGKAVGTVETVPHPDLRIVGASLDMRTMLGLASQVQYQPIPRFPSKSLDTSIVIKEKTAWADVMRSAGTDPLLAAMELIDTYQGQGIPGGKKSLTIRLTWQAPDRTLTEKEASDANARILAKITQKNGAIIRP